MEDSILITILAIITIIPTALFSFYLCLIIIDVIRFEIKDFFEEMKHQKEKKD